MWQERVREEIIGSDQGGGGNLEPGFYSDKWNWRCFNSHLHFLFSSLNSVSEECWGVFLASARYNYFSWVLKERGTFSEVNPGLWGPKTCSRGFKAKAAWGAVGMSGMLLRIPNLVSYASIWLLSLLCTCYQLLMSVSFIFINIFIVVSKSVHVLFKTVLSTHFLAEGQPLFSPYKYLWFAVRLPFCCLLGFVFKTSQVVSILSFFLQETFFSHLSPNPRCPAELLSCCLI